MCSMCIIVPFKFKLEMAVICALCLQENGIPPEGHSGVNVSQQPVEAMVFHVT